MADRTLTINHADGDSETYTINRDKFAGVRSMSVDGSTVEVDHTAVPKERAKETTFGGSQSITIQRDIEPLLSEVAGGAAAAYSLRDLNDKQGNNKVVRVRRASDNAERDFLAKEVSNGTLTNWVNTQTVLPLDIQELEADGRTGAVIPAAAAYSLRNLSKDYTGNVVEVRRASDDTTQNFTAAEVADGTLVSFVTESFQKTLSADPRGEDSTWDVTVVDNSNYTIDCNNNTSNKFCRLIPTPINGGTKYRVDFDFTTNSGDASNLKLNRSSPFNLQDITEGFNSIEFDFTVDTRLAFRIGFASSNVFNATISNLTVTAIGNDGFVKTWYDQSGNSNDATQATAASQPKIVDGGALNTDGIKFDGTDDSLSASYSATTSSVVSVSTPHTVSSRGVIGLGTSVTQASIFYRALNQFTQFAGETLTSSVGYSVDEQYLRFDLLAGASSEIAVNGSIVAQGSSGSNAHSGILIGDSFYNASFDGSIAEVIIYDSDQSANREAIESNIGEAYSLSGIPAYDNTVDGFVETWYDQSGNGNDATQSVAGSQPKIVDGGSLVTGGINFNTTVSNQWLNTASNNVQGVDASTGAFTAFGVLSFDASLSTIIPFSHDNTARVAQLIRTTGSGVIGTMELGNPISATTDQGPAFTSGEKLLATSLSTGNSGTLEAFKNGTGNGSTSITVPQQTAPDYLVIGARIITGASSALDGNIEELILYPSDQSANRAAIETNINNQYDIY